jgi:maltooligosyltrehalose synthase
MLTGGRYRDVFTGREVEVSAASGVNQLRLADVLSHMPVALLERVS